MNILFISNLTGNLWAGPNNSVPAQVSAQCKYDNVLWYNLNHIKRKEWIDKNLPIVNFDDIPSGRLADLPDPFKRPDIVIVEEVYCHTFSKIIYDVQCAKIPYIVIPRSTLTEKAQKHHHWKKIIGNFIYYNGMLRKASGIQFLTQQEFEESGTKWNEKYYILPNGIDMPNERRLRFSNKGINATYIGRFELYQKGLDLLIEAINLSQNKLREANFKLNMYGPDQENTKQMVKKQLSKYRIGDLVNINDSVLGEHKKKVLLNSDVFIMTSRFEGFSMGLIEALSYGLPCLVTNGTNMGEEIYNNRAGWKADCYAESIDKALLALLRDYSNIYEISDNAVKLAEQYSWDNIAKKSHDVLGTFEI